MESSAIFRIRMPTLLTRSSCPFSRRTSSLALRITPSTGLFGSSKLYPLGGFNAKPISSKLSAGSVHGSKDDDEDAFTDKGLSMDVNLLNHMYQQQMKKSDGGDAKILSRTGKEDGEALYLRVDMPGLSKDAVKVSFSNNVVCIKVESGEDEEYSEHVFVWCDGFKVKEMKAEMKNDVLKVVVPRLKVEERDDFVMVNVE